MTGLVMQRRRWVAAAMLGLSAAGGTVAQVASSGVLPPAESVAVKPLTIPNVPPIPVAAPPVMAGLPPLVVTPPAPPVKPAPIATVPVVPLTAPEPPKIEVPVTPPSVPEVKVIAVPAVPPFQTPSAAIPPERLMPIEIELHPPVFAPRTEQKPEPKPDNVAKPAVPVSKASIVKPVKIAVSEIVASGPKHADATVAFKTALADAKAAFSKVRDYSGHLIVQERVKGQLRDEQTAEIRERTQPRSIAVKYLAPSSQVGRELAFLEGRHGNKVRAKEAGTYGPLAFGSYAVSDAKAAVTTRHTLADIGLAGVIDRIDRALATEAKLKNAVAVTAADFTFAGKTVTRFEIHFDRPHALRDAARYVVCIDPDTKLPVRLEVYDAPTTGKLEGTLREAISYVNLSFNQGLGDAPFEK